LPYETGPLALIFISVCRFYKIKTIGIQHAFIYENNPMYSHEKFATNENPQLFPIPDHTLVFGKATKKILVKSGYPPEKIIVFGHPAFFHMDQIKNSLSFKELDKKYCVSLNSKVILFTTGKLQRNYQDTGKYNHDEEIWRHLLKEFSNKEGFHLILKPHPLENDISIYEEILASFSATNAKIIQGNLYELIYLSSLIVSVFSSTMLDALCFNKPVIRVKFGNEFVSTIDSYKVIQSTELSTLSENILNVLSDDNTRKEIDVKRSFFIKDQYGIPENEPAEILSKLLEHLSQ